MVSYQILEKKLEKMKKNHSEKPFNGRIYLYWNLIVISVLKFNSFQFEMEIKWQTVTDVLAPPQAARALAGHRTRRRRIRGGKSERENVVVDDGKVVERRKRCGRTREPEKETADGKSKPRRNKRKTEHGQPPTEPQHKKNKQTKKNQQKVSQKNESNGNGVSIRVVLPLIFVLGLFFGGSSSAAPLQIFVRVEK